MRTSELTGGNMRITMYAHTEFVDLPKKVQKALQEAQCKSQGK